MAADLGGPVLVALFYLQLLCVICTDGACSDCAFATGALLAVPLLMVPLLMVPLMMSPLLLNSACVDSALVSRVVATFGARPTSQLRYTLALRFYQAHLTIQGSAWQNASSAVATAKKAV